MADVYTVKAIRDINTIDYLRDFCSECEVLRHVLSQYTGSKNFNDIMDDLKCTDTLWTMADQNDMKESDMEDWIADHLETSVECRVFQENGPAGGWPVVSVKCMDKMFYLDWVIG